MGKHPNRVPVVAPVIGPKDDPSSLYYQMLLFLESMRVRNYSTTTVEHRSRLLHQFVMWCDERGLIRPQEITRPILERYQHYLYLYRKKDGQPLSGRSQCMHMVPIKTWFRWMTKSHRILSNPAADLDMPKVEKRLPKHILNASEADQVLNCTDISTALGIRDRAIMETFYSTGIRRMECCQLATHDIDYDRGTLMVRQGKGKKDRLLPIGDRALAWITKYRDEVRPDFALAKDEGFLFLTFQGDAMDPRWLSQMVRKYIHQADIGKQGSCHIFRHTMATLMLENGADIRFIQAMLGHEELSTTQIYTQVAIRKLKEVHTLTHPARLERASSAQTQVGEAQSSDERMDAASALLAALDAESEEESRL